jgi:hypothetical protein
VQQRLEHGLNKAQVAGDESLIGTEQNEATARKIFHSGYPLATLAKAKCELPIASPSAHPFEYHV